MNVTRRQSIIAIALPFVISTTNGCSMWKEEVNEPVDLPSTRMSPDSVTIEITFIRIPAGQPAMNQTLWDQVDENDLAVDQQLQLNANGFRIGIMGTQLPDDVRELLGQQERQASLDEPVTSKIDVLTKNRRVQIRAGKRTEIVTSDLRDEIVVLYRDPETNRVTGQTFEDAQCVVAVKSYPLGDGSIKLRVTPEVHHGPVRNQWLPGEGTFRQVTGKKREVYQHLESEVQLNPGEIMALSCTPEMTGAGHSFFVETGQGDAQQKLLLVRLSQSQRNDLFDE